MDATTLTVPTFNPPLHPWWCADVDDDPHIDQPHHSGFEGVVSQGHEFLVGVGLRQQSGGPVCVNLSIATTNGVNHAEAELFLTLSQGVWLWRTLGIAVLLLDEQLWIPSDLASDPFISSRTFPTPTAAFGPMTRPPLDIAAMAGTRSGEGLRIEITAANGKGGAARVALTLKQATDIWRYVTSLLKRLGVVPYHI